MSMWEMGVLEVEYMQRRVWVCARVRVCVRRGVWRCPAVWVDVLGDVADLFSGPGGREKAQEIAVPPRPCVSWQQHHFEVTRRQSCQGNRVNGSSGAKSG